MSTGAPSALFGGLVDDAAIFPPGNAPLPEALSAHRRHATSWYSPLLGPLLISDTRTGDLVRLLDATAAAPLSIAMVVSGGAGALEPALTWAAKTAAVSLQAVEIALRDEDDLARNAKRVAMVLAVSLPDRVHAFVELPRTADTAEAGWMRAADVVAEFGHRLKFRTGGEAPEAHPGARELAGSISAALDRELPFKCTAGLHHAVHNTAPDAGFQHGFLNVALATRAVLDGAGTDDVVNVLAESDDVSIATACTDLTPEDAERLRRWFVSFGSCSIDDPVQDLVELGLLSPAAGHAEGRVRQESR